MIKKIDNFINYFSTQEGFLEEQIEVCILISMLAKASVKSFIL